MISPSRHYDVGTQQPRVAPPKPPLASARLSICKRYGLPSVDEALSSQRSDGGMLAAAAGMRWGCIRGPWRQRHRFCQVLAMHDTSKPPRRWPRRHHVPPLLSCRPQQEPSPAIRSCTSEASKFTSKMAKSEKTRPRANDSSSSLARFAKAHPSAAERQTSSSPNTCLPRDSCRVTTLDARSPREIPVFQWAREAVAWQCRMHTQTPLQGTTLQASPSAAQRIG
ncbi:hypothetical protein EV126DRAFT_116355 [Verticillium dahliae]|nr:hypothetical protein EV126DRAFT_116355 [Verticillium dahliae]